MTCPEATTTIPDGNLPSGPVTLPPETPSAELSSLPSFVIKVFTPSELSARPWFPGLCQAINEAFSYEVNALGLGPRLHSDIQLIQELGDTGFTAVAFASENASSDQFLDDPNAHVIGTASVKNWVHDDKWQPCTLENHTSILESGDAARMGHESTCDGDYEIAIVGLRPGPKYRKRGIADHLIGACQQEILRRLSLDGKDLGRPIRMMIKTEKELNGEYWLKKRFSLVGQQICPTGTWGSNRPFVLWAMARELAVDGRSLC